ncbi:MAG: YkgJ family cysteine cluster protein [Steroidobacteraceae bacterium]
MDPSREVAAGAFGTWLEQARTALRGRGGMQVPCGECVGCCTSHYAILLRPHDAALDIVPAALQASVPGMHYPHARMLPRSDGSCPMFNEGRCAIYAHRPQTCLDYDCRVFAAAGLLAGDRPIINARIGAWRFEYEDEAARRAHAAIRAAATFVQQHAQAFPAGWAPTNPSGVAVLAIKVYELFVADGANGPPDVIERAARIVQSSREFGSEG